MIRAQWVDPLLPLTHELRGLANGVIVAPPNSLGYHGPDPVPGGHTVSTTTPNDLAGRRVLKLFTIGGADDGVTEWVDFDLEVFTPTLGESLKVSEWARQQVLAMRARVVGPAPGYLVDTTETLTRPTPREYGNPDTVRVVATYRLSARLQ